MSVLLRPFKWFYHEFGIVSIHETGRNAYLIILTRSCRMFAYGTNSLILDRMGRRKVLMVGSCLMVVSGAVFAIFENFWILLLAAIVGVISVTGSDFGPFRSIEESVLSQLTTASTRADVLAWYVTTSTLGSSIGSEASGRIIHFLQGRDGWTPVDAYHSLFWVYTAMGVGNAILVLALTDACELRTTQGTYARLPQDEGENVDVADVHDVPDIEAGTQPTRTGSTKMKSWITSRFAQVSAPTRSIMYKLWFLMAVDSLADGMVPYSLTNYYMDTKFHPTKATLGDVTSVSYGLSAIGAVFAGPLARKIGYINTMVFTHVPSSAAVLFFPFPPAFWMTAGLLLVRTGLNNMDQAPRSAFIAAVVKEEERTAVMGITSMVRTLAAMNGPTFTGFLAAKGKFWIAFVVAGTCRLAYDFGLYAMFVNTKLDQQESKPDNLPNASEGRHERDEEEELLEMQSLADSDSSAGGDGDGNVRSKDAFANKGLQLPAASERVRSRSPHRSTAMDESL